MMTEAKEASEKTYDYTLTSLTTSYREEILTGQVKCWLVAHATYNYGTHYMTDERKVGTCDNEIYLIATKSYDASGNATVTANTQAMPTQSEVISSMKKIIEDQIASEIQEMIYQSQIRSCIGKAMTTIDMNEVSR